MGNSYWQKRFELLEEKRNQTAKQTLQSVTPAFDKAQAQIEKEINAWYERFAKNNEISLQEAKRLLNTRELKEFKWDVEEYIKYGRQNALDQKWLKELENASSRYHISRLEALRIRTQNAAEVAFGNELDQLDQMAARLYTDDYYHTAYEIQRGLGLGWDVGQIDERKLKDVLTKPWTADKQTFSDRIWKSKTQLLDSLQTELTQMCILGKDPQQSIDFIAKRMNVSKGQAGRLIMTEASYFGSVAQKDCFNDLDVEYYEIVATLDSRTSEVCQQMDGKVFKMSDFQAGVTAPPFHVWCRTCTVPWFEDNDDGTRAARGADGKTYQVPASMKYTDWKEHFVDKTKDPADWLKVASIGDIVDDGFISKTRERLEKEKVEYRPVQMYETQPSIDEIIERLGGGDKTQGSCSSVAFAYCGNRHGMNVLDFRGGTSRSIFSKNSTISDIANLPNVNGIIINEYNDFKAVKQLLESVIEGKEYYFATGSHAAVIRKTGDAFEYLELQSAKANGFKPLTTDVLKRRFSCKKSHTVYGTKVEQPNMLIDSDLLAKSPEFKRLLGYINTAETEQFKGVTGSVK